MTDTGGTNSHECFFCGGGGCLWWGLYQAPHGDEEGDGEIDYEAVVDAEGGVAVAYGVGNDGEGGVHRGGSACGDGGERSEHFRQQGGE